MKPIFKNNYLRNIKRVYPCVQCKPFVLFPYSLHKFTVPYDSTHTHKPFYQHQFYYTTLSSVRFHEYMQDSCPHYNKHKVDEPEDPVSLLKNPAIPEGHPIDTDGRPLGHVIPDYDIELPALSFGGFSKDFSAWETEPPVYPSTVWPTIAKYDYTELQINHLPRVYEVNMLVLMYIIGIIGVTLSVVGTRWETGNYYKKYGEFYQTGWPCFHYEPNWDIVPLIRRDDGLPPETYLACFVNDQQLQNN